MGFKRKSDKRIDSWEQSGQNVSLNSTGNIVAIGAYGNNSDTGTTRIYE